MDQQWGNKIKTMPPPQTPLTSISLWNHLFKFLPIDKVDLFSSKGKLSTNDKHFKKTFSSRRTTIQTRKHQQRRKECSLGNHAGGHQSTCKPISRPLGFINIGGVLAAVIHYCFDQWPVINQWQVLTKQLLLYDRKKTTHGSTPAKNNQMSVIVW